ncbi:hypothetical protein P7K49_026067 [Saguinus oedipus]|uniref:Uncharacterized protein n=1 Tax=Saguinus oedipus TaxID=9490 RepID=A0ABQ9UJ02_SAGOE|nr:hypothetical protein P7K49_026067 [Saguinus oedipus]
MAVLTNQDLASNVHLECPLQPSHHNPTPNPVKDRDTQAAWRVAVTSVSPAIHPLLPQIDCEPLRSQADSLLHTQHLHCPLPRSHVRTGGAQSPSDASLFMNCSWSYSSMEFQKLHVTTR